ncbi:MAG: hypothetical protein ACE5FI_19635, partial [Anaerolineales bacterium]
MMNVVIQVGNIAVDGVVYLTNGALSLVYWLFEQLAPLVSVGAASFMAAFLDSEVQRRAGYRPRRGRRDRAQIGEVPRQ